MYSVSHNTFCNIFTQVEYISVKFCLFLPVYIHTYLPIALIFLGTLIIFTVSSFESQKVKLPSLHRQWWVAPIHLTSVHSIINFGHNVGVLSQAATEDKISSRVYKCTSVDLACLTGESHSINQSINHY